MPTVLHLTGLRRATLYRKIKLGTFPKQVSINRFGRGWYQSEISRWIADPAGFKAERVEEKPG